MKTIIFLIAISIGLKLGLSAQTIIDPLVKTISDDAVTTTYKKFEYAYAHHTNLLRNPVTNDLFCSAMGYNSGNGYFLSFSENDASRITEHSAKYMLSPVKLIHLDDEIFALLSDESLNIYNYSDYSYVRGFGVNKGADGYPVVKYLDVVYDAKRDLLYYYFKRRETQTTGVQVVNKMLESKSNSGCGSSVPVYDYFTTSNDTYMCAVAEVSSNGDYHLKRVEKGEVKDKYYNAGNRFINVELMELVDETKFCDWANTDFEIDIQTLLNDNCRSLIAARKGSTYNETPFFSNGGRQWKLCNAFMKQENILSIAVSLEFIEKRVMNTSYEINYTVNKLVCFIDIDVAESIASKKMVLKNIIEFSPLKGTKSSSAPSDKDEYEMMRRYDYLGFKIIPMGTELNDIIVMDETHGMYHLFDADLLESAEGDEVNKYYASTTILNSQYIIGQSNYDKPYHYCGFYVDKNSEKGEESEVFKTTVLYGESQNGKQAVIYQLTK
jgi:hypothetical protein